MENLDFGFLANNGTNNAASKWNFDKIYDANICNIKEKMPKADFLSLKASKETEKGKIRNFLRKKMDSLFSSILANSRDPELSLKQAQQLKLLVVTFAPDKQKDFQRAFMFFDLDETPEKKTPEKKTPEKKTPEKK